jgi:hypothetical protein
LAGRCTRRRCAALIPYARNARTHSDQQVAQIAASIREFGFTNPVLIDQEDGIIAGHGRVLGAHLLGLDEVPCIVLAHLTPTQRCAYVLADKQAGEPPAHPVAEPGDLWVLWCARVAPRLGSATILRRRCGRSTKI